MAKRKAKKIIREACTQRLRALEDRQLDRRYTAGYWKMPEGAAWSKVSAKLLSRVLPREKW